LNHLNELSALYINDNNIEEIQGLESLTKILTLDLASNRIREIKGLDSLKDLYEIDLQNNQISSIEGIEVLYGRKAYFFGNPIPQEQLDKIKDKVDLEVD